MTTQPEALRLAALLDINHYEPHVEQAAAAELRRLAVGAVGHLCPLLSVHAVVG